MDCKASSDVSEGKDFEAKIGEIPSLSWSECWGFAGAGVPAV